VVKTVEEVVKRGGRKMKDSSPWGGTTTEIKIVREKRQKEDHEKKKRRETPIRLSQGKCIYYLFEKKTLQFLREF